MSATLNTLAFAAFAKPAESTASAQDQALLLRKEKEIEALQELLAGRRCAADGVGSGTVEGLS